MDWDDEFDDGYDEIGNSSERGGLTDNQGSNGSFSPFDIRNPASAYFFLSDDVQDEISGNNKKKMKCQSCGHRFEGDIYDSCPKCESAFTEEVLLFMVDEDASQSPNMKCLDCGHLFSEESYDSCPECFSTMTEETNQERDDGY